MSTTARLHITTVDTNAEVESVRGTTVRIRIVDKDTYHDVEVSADAAEALKLCEGRPAKFRIQIETTF